MEPEDTLAAVAVKTVKNTFSYVSSFIGSRFTLFSSNTQKPQDDLLELNEENSLEEVLSR